MQVLLSLPVSHSSMPSSLAAAAGRSGAILHMVPDHVTIMRLVVRSSYHVQDRLHDGVGWNMIVTKYGGSWCFHTSNPAFICNLEVLHNTIPLCLAPKGFA